MTAWQRLESGHKFYSDEFEFEVYMFAWFFNLHTKVKLVVLSTFLLMCTVIVSIGGYMSNVASISVAEDISVILNRSYQRVFNTSNAMQQLDSEVLNFLSTADITSAQVRNQFIAKVDKQVQEYLDFVGIMNPNKIGDLDSSVEYQNSIKRLKQDAASLEARFNKTLSLLDKDRFATYKSYMLEVRPLLQNVIKETAFLNRTQIDTVIKLSYDGSSTTTLYVELGVTGLAVILGLLFSHLTGTYISDCIRQQAIYISKMQHNNFDFEIATNKYHDDFGRILHNLKDLKDNLVNSLSEVKVNTARAQDTFTKVANSSINILQNLEECEGKTITVAAATEEMVATNQDIAKNCDEASSLSHSTKDIILDGVKTMQHSIDSIKEQGKLIHDNALAVDKVSQRSLDINAIVNTIEEIAAQTNLLALNAAIEAARAGTAGRGFAVVADEVRALATRTSTATQEISKMVSDIQKDAAEASSSINNSVTAMERTSQETANVEQMMHAIVDHINQVTSQITHIATATEELSASSNEISSNIHSITEVSKTISDHAHNNSQIIRETSLNLESLQNSLQVFKLSHS